MRTFALYICNEKNPDAVRVDFGNGIVFYLRYQEFEGDSLYALESAIQSCKEDEILLNSFELDSNLSVVPES